MPSTKERYPLESTEDLDAENEIECKQSIHCDLQISVAPKWNEQYCNCNLLDTEQIEESIYFQYETDSELFMNLLISDENQNQDAYAWCGVSEIFDTVTIISQQTVETVTNDGALDFTSNPDLSFMNTISSIYEYIIETLQSFHKNNDNFNILYPWNLIYPQTEDTCLPIVSENGLYFIKLFFCGEWRAVLINDKFATIDGQLVFPIISDSNEIWTQLLTKAILKILILSNRINNEIISNKELLKPIIIQLLTSNIPIEKSQIQNVIDKDDEKNEIPPLFDIKNQNTSWSVIHSSFEYKQRIEDLINDKTVIISNESHEINAILQIDSLNKHLTQNTVSLFMYNITNNTKKCIQTINMKNGFVSLMINISPNTIYLIEVNNCISYSATLYSNYTNIYMASRFGDVKLWEMINYKMIDIVSESKCHSISQTFILFDMYIKVLSDSKCRIIFHSIFNDKSLSNSLILYVVNLDNCMDMKFIPNLNLSTFYIEPNTNGYSLIAFSKPNNIIKNSKYEIKMLYKGEMEIENQLINMESSLDFQINYTNNFDRCLMKDEITSDDDAKFMFSEIYFQTNPENKINYGEFGKIIEFIDKDTNKIIAQYKSTQSSIYIPQMFIGNKNLFFVIKFDKNNHGLNPDQLFKDDSIQCTVRIISNGKIRLFPDNSKQLKFQEIKQAWQKSKGRAQTAKQTREKYLQQPMQQRDVIVKKTENKEALIVNEAFWNEQTKANNKCLTECDKRIKNEQQFRSEQSNKIDEHISYITQIQKESFENIKLYSDNDLKERESLRTERLEWNKQLTEMEQINDEMKQNFENLKGNLILFNSEINKEIQSIQNVEITKKGKGKSKSKPFKSSVNMIFSSDIISKLIKKCKNIEQIVPKWLYGNQINECYIAINSILYDILFQVHTQFSELINYKMSVNDLSDEFFKICSEKYINLCSEIFAQIDMVNINCKYNEKLKEIQNECNDIIVKSIFNKLESLHVISHNDEILVQENEINVDTVKNCLSEIQFGSDAKNNILVNQYTIQLKQTDIEYVRKVEKWIKQKEESDSNENITETA